MRKEIISMQPLISVTSFRRYSWLMFDFGELYPTQLTEAASRYLSEILRAFRDSHKAAPRRISGNIGLACMFVYDIPIRSTSSLLKKIKSVVLDKANWKDYDVYLRNEAKFYRYKKILQAKGLI